MLKNFLHLLRHYTMSSVLNIIGLTVAFTAFIIIMIQVNFDNNFDNFHPKADRTYRIEYTNDSLLYMSGVSRPMGEEIIALSPDIEAGSAITQGNFAFYLPGGDPEKSINEPLNMVHPQFVDMMGFEFEQGDGTKLTDRTSVIVSEKIAQKLFPGETALGKELFFNRGGEVASLTITGVYRNFPKNSILADNGIYRNIGEYSINNQSEWSFPYYVTLTNKDKKADVDVLIAKLVKEKAGENEDFGIRLTPITELHFTQDMKYDGISKADRTTMSVLFSVAIIILLIAAINFLNFALALVPLRVKSINIQKILGSSVFKLRFTQISEAVFLALIAFGLSILVVYGLASTSFTTLLTAPLELDINRNLLIYSGLVAIATGILAGLIPAFYSTAFKPVLVLKGSFGSSSRGQFFRTVLIGFQYISSIILFCTAMFMILQNSFMKSHPVGFDRENIVCAYTSNTVAESNDALRTKLMTNPQIKDAAFSAGPIVSNSKMGWGRSYKGKQVSFDCFVVSSNFIEFMDMEVVEGRGFKDEDNQKVNGTFVFNEKAVAEFGFKIGEVFQGHVDTAANIVGVVKNFNFQPMQYGISPIALYVFGTEPWWKLTFLNVRITNTDVPATLEFIKNTIREFDPKMTDINIDFMDKSIGALYEKEQNQATLISLFALMAIAISLVGVFGLVVFETQYRRREIGLRRINGATVGLILMMFNRKFIWIVGICFVLAVPVAWYAVDQWLSGFAYRTSIHWWVFGVALLIVLVITMLTVTIQSWRAATENPVESIKAE